jgi:hypothetical protein
MIVNELSPVLLIDNVNFNNITSNYLKLIFKFYNLTVYKLIKNAT